MEEVKQMKHFAIKHMKVKYNVKNNKLIYDRKLYDGGGNNMYGLEVCKSLNLPEKFLKLAMSIRKTPTKKNKYNSNKLSGPCEMCGCVSDDVHHLRYQSESDNNGYINSFHKNHVANLINICKTCHVRIHKLNIRYEKKKTMEGVELLISNNNNI